MATFLFDKIIFGPVKSRRLGVSLGINLLPVKRKVCNFIVFTVNAAGQQKRPSEVMIYTISRDTPEGGDLHKVPLSELNRIASLVNEPGIKTQVSG